MSTPNPVANPFAMMLDPQAVLAQVMHSERLSRLQSRICRPLDKPLLGAAADGDADSDADDTTDPSDDARSHDTGNTDAS